jgi:gamma-glutamylcyclotransferase (GGCT)/AIG2-like uncharacterized protein YtfP
VSRVLYFAYGSNLDADQLATRCPTSEARFRARLRDHRLDFTHFSSHWVGGAADVLPHSGDEVWGFVYEMDETDLTLLDRFEGGYDRVVLWVEADDGRDHRTISYTVRNKHTFTPTEVYLEKMLRWGEHWELPPGYLARLRTFRR